MQFRSDLPAFLAGLVLLITSCASSNLGRSWVSTDVKGGQFKKLGIVALTNQEVYRREAEWALVEELGGRGVASYQLLEGLNSLRDTANVIRTLQQAGCDGIVTMQLKSAAVQPDVSAKPSETASVGATMDDYWVDPSAQQAESFAAGQYFSVEVHVFDMAARKMVYNGLVIEQGARNTADLVAMVKRDVMEDLRQKGVVQGK